MNISKNLNLIKIFNISFNYLLDPSKFGSLSIAVFPGANKASLSILNDVVPMGRGFEWTNQTMFSSQGGDVNEPLYLK